MSVLDVRGLVKSYAANRVVDDISFSLAEGECLALLGPSGCGKTTLLNIVAGFIEPEAGTVSMEGRPITSAPPHQRNMGMVFQDYALFPHLNVYENVEFGLKMRGARQSVRRETATQVLQLVGLGEFGERNVAQLSGGQRQRVAVARALAIRPKLLLFDEPLSNLDSRLRETMRAEIRHLLTRTGLTALFVTHDQSEAFAVADRVAVLNKGRVEQIGPPREIYDHPETEYAAECLGACNLIEGNVVSADAGVVVVQACGTVLRAPASGAPVGPGERVVLVVRPHDVRLSADAVDSVLGNCVRGRVSHVERLGTHSQVAVRADATAQISAIASNRTGVAVDDVAAVAWDVDATWIVRKR